MDVAIGIVDNCFQLKLENGDLKAEQGLETAVSISLFSNQRVSEEELPPGISSRQGWWGDLFPEVEGDQIGSKVWSLDRDKSTLETAAQLESFAKESLAWMLEDGVASSISVEAAINEDNAKQIDHVIQISRPTGETDRFGIIWDEQELKRL